MVHFQYTEIDISSKFCLGKKVLFVKGHTNIIYNIHIRILYIHSIIYTGFINHKTKNF